MLFQTDEKSPFLSREWGFFVGYYPQRSFIIKLFLLCHLVLFELPISAQNNIDINAKKITNIGKTIRMDRASAGFYRTITCLDWRTDD